jgi:NitT/TauT family transport system ATP-binding protein
LNVPARLISPPLLGRFDTGNGRSEQATDFHIFHRGNANVPVVAKAAEIQAALVQARLLGATSVSPELPRRLFREDLYREALNQPNEILSSNAPGGALR